MIYVLQIALSLLIFVSEAKVSIYTQKDDISEENGKRERKTENNLVNTFLHSVIGRT